MPEYIDNPESSVEEKFVTAGDDPVARAKVLFGLLYDTTVPVEMIIEGSEAAILRQRQPKEGELHE